MSCQQELYSEASQWLVGGASAGQRYNVQLAGRSISTALTAAGCTT